MPFLPDPFLYAPSPTFPTHYQASVILPHIAAPTNTNISRHPSPLNPVVSLRQVRHCHAYLIPFIHRVPLVFVSAKPSINSLLLHLLF